MFTNHSHYANIYAEQRMGRPDELGVLQSNSWERYHRTEGRHAGIKPTHLDSTIHRPFIAIPVNVNESHWILLIFAYVCDLLDSQALLTTPRTSIIVLDSMSGCSIGFDDKFRGFLWKMVNTFRPDLQASLEWVKVYRPEVCKHCYVLA
jgi:hypothetical protein